MEPDDFASDTSTLGTIALGGSVSGRMNSPTDTDWFKFTATAGQVIKFSIPFANLSASEVFQVYDAQGNFISYLYRGNAIFEPPSSGDYYIGVSHQFGSLGNYTLSATLIADDFGGTFSNATAIAYGSVVSANLNYVNDKDMFKFQVSEGQAVSFEFLDLADNGQLNYSIYNSYGLQLNGSSAVVGSNQGNLIPDRSGTYFISFQSTYNNDLGDYSFKINNVVDDYAGDLSSTGVLTVNGPGTVVRNDFAGDFDVLKVNVAAAGVVRFEATGIQPPNNLQYLALYNSAGDLMTDASLFRSDMGLNFDFASAGTYYLGIDKYRLTEDSKTFTVSATSVVDDYKAGITTTGVVVANGAAVSGTLEYNQDFDAFKITGTAGYAFTVVLSSPTFEHEYSILNGAGVVSRDAREIDGNMNYYPLDVGDLYLRVEGRVPGEKGAYSFTINTIPDDLPHFTRGTLGIGSGGVGVIEFYADSDIFNFVATAGQTVVFSAPGQSFYNLDIIDPARPNFDLVNGSTTAGGSAPKFGYTFETAGTYGIRYSGQLGTYTIVASNTVDDYSNNKSTTGVLNLTGGTVTGSLSAYDPGDWFKFIAVAGDRITFTQAFSTIRPAYSALSIRRADGSEVVDNIDGDVAGNNVTRMYDFKQGGVYFIEVEEQVYRDGIRPYTLSAARFADDWAGSTSTTGVITLGGAAVTGTVEFTSEEDWFAVSMSAGQGYVFNMTSTTSYGGDASQPSLKLYDSAGQAITLYQPDGLTSINYTATTSGTYYVAASTRTTESTYSVTGIASFGNPLDAMSTGTRLFLTGPFPNVTTVPSQVVDIYFAPAGESFNGLETKTWNTADIQSVMNLVGGISNSVNITFRITNLLTSADLALFRYNDPNTVSTVENTQTRINAINAIPNLGFSNNFAFNSGAGLAAGGLGGAVVLNGVGYGLGLAFPHSTSDKTYRFPGVTSDTDIGLNGLNQGVFTMMSFNDGWASNAVLGASPGTGSGFQAGPMAFDIAALQALYGANATFAAGANTYQLADANGVGTAWRAIWDTGGVDEIVYGGTRDATIDLRAATISYNEGGGGRPSWLANVHGGFTIAQGVVIENARGGFAHDLINGNFANNVLDGMAGNDTINGWDGNDTLIGGAGVNILNGGNGFDTADLSAETTPIFMDLAIFALGSSFTFGNNQLISIESIIFGSGNDTVVGSTLGDFVQTSDGNDFVATGLGNDTIYGGRGSDILSGGDGNDNISAGAFSYALGEAALSSDLDYVYAGEGNDYIINGGRGIDVLLGESGNDTINDADGVLSYILGGSGINSLASNANVSVFLSEGSADTMTSNSASAFYYRFADGSSSVTGGAGIDQFIGGNALSNDAVSGGIGDDFLFGGNGNDLLSGGAGNDVILGQNGNDTLDGGAGVNLLWANDAGSDQILVKVADGGTQVVDYFEAGGTNDVVRILGSSLTSFAGIQNLVDNLGVIQGNNLMVNVSYGSQLYLNLGANQTAIWFQGINAYSLTSADFLFA
jgi:serralysin